MTNVILLGLVSLFTDISTEMVYPILPLYLSSVLGATPAIIGVIEGIAESLASVLKLFSGIIVDRYGNKKRLAFFGYASSTVNKVILLFASTWAWVLIARIIDRFGKGIRTAPRDALIAESSGKTKLGKAYGLHKGLDLLGTAIGILLAWFIMRNGGDQYRRIFLFSMIPAFIGLAVLFFVREVKGTAQAVSPSFGWEKLDGRLRAFLIIIFIFTLGHFSNAFVILRSCDAGFSHQEAVLLYFLFNITGSLLSLPMGQLSDKIGRKTLLCLGYFLFGIVYMGFGLLADKTLFIVLFVLYGVYAALTSGVERALIVEIAPESQKASALGLHAAITGMGLLPASIIAGRLWDSLGPSVPFITGGILAFITGAAVLIIFARKQQELSHV